MYNSILLPILLRCLCVWFVPVLLFVPFASRQYRRTLSKWQLTVGTALKSGFGQALAVKLPRQGGPLPPEPILRMEFQLACRLSLLVAKSAGKHSTSCHLCLLNCAQLLRPPQSGEGCGTCRRCHHLAARTWTSLKNSPCRSFLHFPCESPGLNTERDSLADTCLLCSYFSA